MNQDDWYKERILWRANQHRLLEKQCMPFSDLPEEKQIEIKEMAAPNGIPVLIFSNERVWTLLTTREIVTYYDGRLSKGQLDNIEKGIVPIEASGEEAIDKNQAMYLGLTNLQFNVWVPGNPELFALWSILKMFPLNPGSATGTGECLGST
ncbi:MAG: hypothetical protein JW719_05325 [Pirellulales bacterium]|nr:hypothetical protein [Pirellulales bacterium]